MGTYVCPWWIYSPLNWSIRKSVQNPVKLFENYVKSGDRVIDMGCGPGFFTFGLAALVGSTGKVYATDIQDRALELIKRRSIGTSFENTINTLNANKEGFEIDDKFDFVLNFWMLHEVENKPAFISKITQMIKPESRYLLVEPKFHVNRKHFEEEVNLVISHGMKIVERPKIWVSRACLFMLQ
jgi:ubiquinone/menaquinone biosynthesis C-methylase UbiE